MSFFDQHEKEERERSVIPKGPQIALIENAALSEKRSDMISITLKVGERKAWVNLIFTEKAVGVVLGKLKELNVYEAVKLKIKDPTNLQEIQELTYKELIPLCGTKWDIDVTHREYEGRLQNNIRFLGQIDTSIAQAPGLDASEEIPF